MAASSYSIPTNDSNMYGSINVLIMCILTGNHVMANDAILMCGNNGWH